MSESQASSDESQQRMEELNADTGGNSSAEELKERIDERSAHTSHGTSEGDPDPMRGENSPEEAGTHQEGMQEVDTQERVATPREERGLSAPQP